MAQSGQHVSLLFVPCLTGEPRGSRGSMVGVINGQEFGMATLNISVRQQGSSEVSTIWSSISHVPASVGMSGVGAGMHAGPHNRKGLFKPSAWRQACLPS